MTLIKCHAWQSILVMGFSVALLGTDESSRFSLLFFLSSLSLCYHHHTTVFSVLVVSSKEVSTPGKLSPVQTVDVRTQCNFGKGSV